MGILFKVGESPRVYVERIDVNGNTLTQDKVVRREFRLNEGDAFNTSKLRRSRQRVQNLGFCQLGHAHNDLAQWAATLGIPGLLVIVAIYLVPLLQFLKLVRRDTRKSASGAAWAGLMLVLVFLLSGMTQSMFSHALSTMTYVVFVGLLLGLALRESTGRTPGLA